MERVLCPECITATEYDVVTRRETLPVRGEDIVVEAKVAVCRECGADIAVDTLDDATLRAAFGVYRARHGLLMPEHIREIRGKYGLGQKAFARLLGWGDVTLSRYETGSLQSKSHDATLRAAEDPRYVRRMYQLNGDRLTPDQAESLMSCLDQLSPEHESLIAREEPAHCTCLPAAKKLAEMMVYFAEFPQTWRTKLNRMLFYADFLHAKRHGVTISGARYVHMQFGPVPGGFYALQGQLVDEASLDEVPAEAGDREGTIFVARRPADRSVFSESELRTLEDVGAHFATWSAGQIVEYSRQEPAWIETDDRETISLGYASSLRLE